MRHASEECWYVVCVKCGEIEIKIGRDVPVRSHEGWFQFGPTCSCQETRAAYARAAAAVMEDSAASVESVSATMLREIATSSADVVGGNGGEDAVGDSPEVVEGDLVGEEGVRRRTQAS